MIDFNTLYQDLFLSAIKGGFETIAQTAHSYFKRPLILLDVQYNILTAYPKQPIGDRQWDSLYHKSSVPEEYVLQFGEHQYARIAREKNEPLLANWGIVQDAPRLMSCVRVDGLVRGYVSVIVSKEECIQELKDALSLVAKAFGLEFQKHPGLSMEASALHSAFLEALIKKNISSTEALKRWMQKVHGGISGDYCMIAAACLGNRGTFLPLDYVYKHVWDMGEDMISLIRDNVLYVLVTGLGKKKVSTVKMDHVLEKLKKYKFSVGVSRVYSNLLETSSYYYQSIRALDSMKLKNDPWGIVYYDQCALQDMFCKLLENMEPVHYLHPAIRTLQIYDKEQNADYLQTLEEYIEHFCEHSSTAKSMNIHRNTLFYRIRRIQEIADIDLNDLDTCTHLLNSFYLMKLDNRLADVSV
jgi:sugar diacid utilization regulator